MPFPLVPLAITGISAGLSKLFGGDKTQKNIKGKINPSLDQLLNYAGYAQGAGRSYTDQARPQFNKAIDYFSGILDPNSTNALDALVGPSRTKLADQYRNQMKSMAEFMPRGGGQGAANAGAAWDFNRALIEPVMTARRDAATQLGSLGQALASLGIDFNKLSAQQLGQVLSFIGGQGGGSQYGYGQNSGLFEELGGILGPFLSGSLSKGLKGIFGGGGGGGNNNLFLTNPTFPGSSIPGLGSFGAGTDFA